MQPSLFASRTKWCLPLWLLTVEDLLCLHLSWLKSNGKDKLRVANIIEEGKLGGPHLRIVNIAKLIKEEVDTTVIMPSENSDDFRLFVSIVEFLFKSFPLAD